jgi:hypothetical protein
MNMDNMLTESLKMRNLMSGFLTKDLMAAHAPFALMSNEKRSAIHNIPTGSHSTNTSAGGLQGAPASLDVVPDNKPDVQVRICC